jgi:dihydrofolate reductase
MGNTIMGAVVSLDGYIADIKGDVGPLFDWYGNGDVGWKVTEKHEHPCRTTQASRDFMQAVYPQIGGQALRLGLIDQVVMNVVPVVFGAGRPFFGAMDPGDAVILANPSRVVDGDRMMHLLYDVVSGSRDGRE